MLMFYYTVVMPQSTFYKTNEVLVIPDIFSGILLLWLCWELMRGRPPTTVWVRKFANQWNKKSVKFYSSEGSTGGSSGILFSHKNGLLVFIIMRDEQTLLYLGFIKHQTVVFFFFSNVLGLPKSKTRFALSIFPFIFKPLCILREI